MKDSRPTPSRVVTTPTLQARATLSADYSAPGPDSGALATPNGPVNGRTGPFRGQVVPGFSGVVANGDGTFWAMPDNGFGSKANSADFLLRVYEVAPDFETGRRGGGSGTIDVERFISLRDPDHKIKTKIVNEDTTDRLLTGADFDIESIVRQPDGTFWIGEEFGPYLLHVSKSGKLLSAPVPFVGGKSPDNPTLAAGETPAIGSSRGFEAMAGSKDGRYLYPILEGALNADADKRRRLVYEFDTKKQRYTGTTWAYETDTDANFVGDAHLVGPKKLVVLERDNFDGAQAVTKRVYDVDLNRRENGFARKRLKVDLLQIANPERIGTTTSPGAYGVGANFSFAFQSTETVVPLSGGRYLFANDNNYPGNAARYPGRPDDTEMIIVGFPKVRTDAPANRLIGHRGASGYRPEHTLASYELAIRQCADYIEPDVVPTKDGKLVARHEPNITDTTDVSTHPEFADRKTTKTIDGSTQTGWFTEDFTLAELRTLRTKERLPQLRTDNTAFDGLYPIPTLDEVFDLALHSRTCAGKPVGVAPETKHPTYFASIGLPTDAALLKELKAHGWTKKSDPVVIQSFETTNLKSLAKKSRLPLIQLVDCSGAPYDLKAAGEATTYADLVTPAGLRGIKRYADQVALCKDRMIPRDADGRLLAPTTAISDAHRVGLRVTGWTFRRENQFLPLQFRSSTVAAEVGDLDGEINAFLDAGMDDFFTDNPDVGQEARS
ncbi:glycerophosphoryl diester phosphodiesterase [Microlunatus sagamiharensis]|uniref:glycerophosphodiester phosphodiesterase n=1 Tax=Microlunatus sagamiharensis TaxID=546874 RepID=A0A1H2NHQ6_9ACTN|nr:glycerophosphoryl diester phosphodiesterase [Microlunatus sagamiharensis]